MSNELQLVTTNSAADGWVDGTPGAVSTGYQAQNTAIQALFNGVDKSSCSVSGANLVIAAGGLIDDSGLPFVITDAITLALPTTGAANWFLRVVPGSTALERSIEFTDDRGTYDAAKNGFYDGDGYRVLNWVYSRHTNTIHLIGCMKNSLDIKIGQKLIINSGTSQVINNSAWVLLTNYGTPSLDNFSAWEKTSSDTYDIIESNIYRISAELNAASNFVDDTIGLAIFIDDTISLFVGRTDGTETNSSPQSIQVYAEIALSAGQNVKIYAYSSAVNCIPKTLSIIGDSSLL